MKNPFAEVVSVLNFNKLWLAQILSQFSLNLLNFVLVLLIFEQTGSVVAVSLVWIFYAIPAILLGPFSGTIVDLISRRKILMLTTLLQGVVVLFYLFVRRSIWPIYPIIFSYSILNQFYVPAEAAMLPSVVQRRLLPVANTLFLFTVYFAFLVGASLAGPTIQLFGRRTPFVIASILLFASSILLSFLPEPKTQLREAKLGIFFDRLVEGYQFLRGAPLVFLPLVLLVVGQIIIAILAVTAPALAVNVLQIPLVEASTRLVAPVGLGAISGAILVVRILAKLRKKYVIAAGFFLSSLAFLVFATLIPELSNRVLLGSILAFILGVAFVATIIPLQTLLQEKIPESLRGRVFGVLSFLIMLASLIPVLFAATVAELVGELVVLGILAVLLFVLGIAALNFEEVLTLPLFVPKGAKKL